MSARAGCHKRHHNDPTKEEQNRQPKPSRQVSVRDTGERRAKPHRRAPLKARRVPVPMIALSLAPGKWRCTQRPSSTFGRGHGRPENRREPSGNCPGNTSGRYRQAKKRGRSLGGGLRRALGADRFGRQRGEGRDSTGGQLQRHEGKIKLHFTCRRSPRRWSRSREVDTSYSLRPTSWTTRARFPHQVAACSGRTSNAMGCYPTSSASRSVSRNAGMTLEQRTGSLQTTRRDRPPPPGRSAARYPTRWRLTTPPTSLVHMLRA